MLTSVVRHSAFLCAIIAAILTARPTDTRAAQDFETFLQGVRTEARERGLNEHTIRSALSDVTRINRVLELDRKQPEFTLTIGQYMSRVVSQTRVKKGRARLAKHGVLLREVSAKFKVQPRFIVALWGIETDFGRLKGGFPVIASLATLAHDGRRSAYFRKELFNALTIIDQGHITAKEMIGSWAGAMGQNQFMPSSFLRYAVDHDGDGQRNIWTSHEDVFASTANYLARAGWRHDQTWGRRIKLPQNFNSALLGLKTRKGLNDWQILGVRRFDGNNLPTRNLSSSILRHGEAGPTYLVYNNYRAILRWNRAHFFATAVGRLADQIAGG